MEDNVIKNNMDKRIIIQHNFLTGMGDCVQAMYEYLDTAKDLKNLGFETTLIINDTKNMYFDKGKFFDFFNENEFKKYFDSIEFSEEFNHVMCFRGMDQVYHDGNVTPYGYIWALFVPLGHYPEIKSEVIPFIKKYRYLSNVETDNKKIINEDLIKRYKSHKVKLGLDKPYNSLYYRTHDLEDNEDTYATYDDEIMKLVSIDKKIFVCSNSYGFKKYMESKNLDNVILNQIPGEETNGNQINLDYSFFDNMDVLHVRTEYVIYEMLALSDSDVIDFYTLWNRISNFIFFARINKTKMNFRTLNYEKMKQEYVEY